MKAFAFLQMSEPGADGEVTEDLSVLSYAELLARGFDIAGTAGSEILNGSNLDDRFDGRRGDDILRGGKGNDSYFVGLGSGHDEIEDVDAAAGNVDSIVIGAGISPESVQVFLSGGRLTISFSEQDGVAIAWNPAAGAAIERVEFADGTIWDVGELLSRLPGGGNLPPVLAAPIGDLQVFEDADFGYEIRRTSFYDPDSDESLTYSASLANGDPLPQWLHFDPARAIFAGTPSNEDVGGFDVLLRAEDRAGEMVRDEFHVEVVNVNDLPQSVGAAADASVRAGQVLDYASAGVFRDIDAGDTLTYRASLASGELLPSWLSFDQDAVTFFGLPSETDVGAWRVSLQAIDRAGASASSVFNIFVAPASSSTPPDTSMLDPQVAPQSVPEAVATVLDTSRPASQATNDLVERAAVADGDRKSVV